MIKEFKKIIKSEIKKVEKKNIYKKVVGVDTTKIQKFAIGKLSY